jgi:hypothetical protein
MRVVRKRVLVTAVTSCQPQHPRLYIGPHGHGRADKKIAAEGCFHPVLNVGLKAVGHAVDAHHHADADHQGGHGQGGASLCPVDIAAAQPPFIAKKRRINGRINRSTGPISR